MLKISRITDYGLVILCQMLRNNGRLDEPLSARGLANDLKLPLPTVSKVLKLLAKNGLIEAKRGVFGGYVLKSLAREASLLKLIETFEGPMGLTDCLKEGVKICPIDDLCQEKPYWHLINHKIKLLLEDIKLKDFLRNKHS